MAIGVRQMNSSPEGIGFEGPIREDTVRVAGRTIRLVRPVEPDRLLDDPSVIARNAAEDYMPYWAYLWPGSVLLGEAVATLGPGGGAWALELGCGLGLSGLVAVAQGWRVRFTDHDPTTLRFLEASAAANGFDPSAYSTALLSWEDPPEGERYPLILGADVTYEARIVPLVVRAIAALLAPGGLALLSDPNRTAAEGLGEAARRVGLEVESTPAEGDFEGVGRIRGTIHRVRNPGAAEGNPGRW